MAQARVLVIGTGPAGLSAALNSALEGFETWIVSPEFGGRAAQSAAIDNVLGMQSISGAEFAARAGRHAAKHGVRFIQQTVRELRESRVVLDDDTLISADAIVIATGLSWKRLDIPGLAFALSAKRAHYGCQFTDAERLRGKVVGILGGANSAGINALHFAGAAREVVIFCGRSGLEKMSHYLYQDVMAQQNIFVEHSELGIERIELRLGGQGLWIELSRSSRDAHLVDELFLFPGAKPELGFLPSWILQDEQGFLSTNAKFQLLVNSQTLDCFGEPVGNLYAIGDVRSGSVKRIASAIGEGAAVVHFIKQRFSQKGFDSCSSCVA